MIVRKASCEDFDKIDTLLELWIDECNPDNYDFKPEAEDDKIKNAKAIIAGLEFALKKLTPKKPE